MRAAAAGTAGLVLLACGGSGLAVDPIFIEGRSVVAAGDSMFATTRSGHTGIIVRHRKKGETREIGAGVLHSPWHVQWMNGEWYVSDIEDGKPGIVVLGPEGELKRRITLAGATRTPHQFAVLPDGRIIVESPEAALIALAGDSSSVFSVTDRAAKTGLLLGAAGGVLHAVPDRFITLYNAFGHMRWRLEWPWARTAYVSEVTVDRQGRIHVLLGVPADSTFRAYTMSNQSGEIIIWSEPSRNPTFVVDRLGQLKRDEAGKWVE